MSRSTIQRIFAASALVVAASAALAFGVAHLRREPPREVEAVASLPSVSSPASEVQGKNPVGSATALITTNVASAAGSTDLPGDAKTPAFDVARIDSRGDAVIAGSAAPGASVELLRDGEVEDRVIADRSGQFVMTPTRLPVGEYQLTLRSTQADGKQSTSKQSVAVVLQPPAKEQTAVALLTPDKAGSDANVSYRGLPPLTPAPASVPTTATHRSAHRHIGHHFHVYHEQRHRFAFATHRTVFARAAQASQTSGICSESGNTMLEFLCFLGYR